MTPNAQATEEKKGKLDFIKVKFVHQKTKEDK